MMNLPIWINSANQVGDRGWAMRSVFKKIIEILDGTPAVYGKQKRWRGQSVVELTLVSPLLIVLLMGLAEIGWFANNFLILLIPARWNGTIRPAVSLIQDGMISPLILMVAPLNIIATAMKCVIRIIVKYAGSIT
jgi:hypothetical protein